MIGKYTLVADKVLLMDIDHCYTNIGVPIGLQPLKVAPVEIGDESWIGENSVILPGARIGRHCMVAANSVVNSEIPDFLP